MACRTNQTPILSAGKARAVVLDFGVACLTDSDVKATMQTSLGEVVGTLAYMSPEQTNGDSSELDTRSDVYRWWRWGEPNSPSQ